MNHVGNLGKLEHRELRSTRTGEAYSHSAPLLEALGFKGFSLHHEIIQPGRKASGAHAHSEREEAVIVLEGQLKATLNGQVHRLGPGSFIGFLPGEMHVIENDSQLPACVLLVASRADGDQVAYG